MPTKDGAKSLTVQVSAEFHQELCQMAEDLDITVVALVKRALALQKYLYQHQDAVITIREGDMLTRLVLADHI